MAEEKLLVTMYPEYGAYARVTKLQLAARHQKRYMPVLYRRKAERSKSEVTFHHARLEPWSRPAIDKGWSKRIRICCSPFFERRASPTR